jgi:hypothetical protein
VYFCRSRSSSSKFGSEGELWLHDKFDAETGSSSRSKTALPRPRNADAKGPDASKAAPKVVAASAAPPAVAKRSSRNKKLTERNRERSKATENIAVESNPTTSASSQKVPSPVIPNDSESSAHGKPVLRAKAKEFLPQQNNMTSSAPIVSPNSPPYDWQGGHLQEQQQPWGYAHPSQQLPFNYFVETAMPVPGIFPAAMSPNAAEQSFGYLGYQPPYPPHPSLAYTGPDGITTWYPAPPNFADVQGWFPQQQIAGDALNSPGPTSSQQNTLLDANAREFNPMNS